MKKILLIIALTLLCSFSVNAQEVETKAKAIDASKLIGKKISTEVPVVAQDVVTGTKSGPVAEMKKAVVDPNCRTSLTADEAYKSTADGNVNTFGATYSSVTTRCAEAKALEAVSAKELKPAREFEREELVEDFAVEEEAPAMK